MASWTPLSTYDPDWQERWDRCHAALTASRAEQRAQDWACDAELDARCSRELDELNAAYHSRFRTVGTETGLWRLTSKLKVFDLEWRT